MSFSFTSGVYLEEQYPRFLEKILTEGQPRDVRGFKTMELSPFAWSTNNPLANILTNEKRKINKAFAVAEWLWLMSGRDDVKMVSYYNNNISQFSDNKINLSGAYGPKIKQQLNYIINCFENDINTRQAVMTLWERNPKPSKDIPCTLSIHFLHNSSSLDVVVNMRSNDFWLGFPYDFYNFTMLQNYIAFKLNLKIGRYTHVASSAHLYDNHFEKAAEVSKMMTTFGDIKYSSRILHDELDLILSAEESMRRGQDCELILGILHEPWKSMAETLKTFCRNKNNNCVQKE